MMAHVGSHTVVREGVAHANNKIVLRESGMIGEHAGVRMDQDGQTQGRPRQRGPSIGDDLITLAACCRCRGASTHAQIHQTMHATYLPGKTC